MPYESSYDSGRIPFVPDTTRGTWSAPGDFIFACLGLAFKGDLFLFSWIYLRVAGTIIIVPCLLSFALYVVPLVVVQSFMGQFSSSGFISSFRVSPLFKGMGYISIALNILILTYNSIFAAIPLLYIFTSFQPTLPWNCQSFRSWSHTIDTSTVWRNVCNLTEVEIYDKEYGYMYPERYHVPSVIYFKSLFGPRIDDHRREFGISWQLVGYNLLVWLIIAVIFYKFFNAAKLGRILRYLFYITTTLLFVCLTKCLFLPGAIDKIDKYFVPTTQEDIRYAALNSLFFGIASFGSGWGTVITLASFNRFKTNIMTYSWVICFGQMFIFIAFDFVTFLLYNHFMATIPDYRNTGRSTNLVTHHMTLYLSNASALTDVKLSNMWIILFNTMLATASFTGMITQLYSILTSVFDEFEVLRSRKNEVTYGLIGSVAIASIYFCTTSGFFHFTTIAMDTVFGQTALNLFLLLVILWVYGRERFQRDIEFMLGQPFATWKIFMLRFVAPLFLLLTLFIAFLHAVHMHNSTSIILDVASILFILMPWLFVPGYCIFILLQTAGTLRIRFKRCCKPTDWYPIDMEERQRYEELLDNTDITQQLKNVNENVH